MIVKRFVETERGVVARVTFAVPNSAWADVIHLVGDFNAWNHHSHPLKRDRQGKWILTVDLEIGRAYQFRYLVDGRLWTNDNDADAYVHNSFGSDNFVVVTDENFRQYHDGRS